jgi:hypothetical protein
MSSHGYSCEEEITYVPLLCSYPLTCLLNAVVCESVIFHFSTQIVTVLVICHNKCNFSICNNEIYISQMCNSPHANVVLIVRATSERRKLAFVILIYVAGAHSKVK